MSYLQQQHVQAIVCSRNDPTKVGLAGTHRLIPCLLQILQRRTVLACQYVGNENVSEVLCQ